MHTQLFQLGSDVKKISSEALILASASPRRRILIESIGINFKIIPSCTDEILDSEFTPQEQVKALALKKAAIVSKMVQDGIVIGADSLVCYNDMVFGKPRNKSEAKEMLMTLRNNWHTIVTGVAVIDVSSEKHITRCVETQIKMTLFSEREIEKYLDREKPMDRAGAYGIQGSGVNLVEAIFGCYSNALGLPICQLIDILHLFDLAGDLKAPFPACQISEDNKIMHSPSIGCLHG